jgi:diaminohydroxyphosphoribosylaminopyrimidine deaminase/5-amino-6-(5-phosphoribosylamino)uracil reductase
MMAESLRLGRLRKGRTGPNPAVGCVIARGDEVVGRGYHERAGEAHAEVVALREAGPRARGATLYVTLEPCCTVGRTPACAPGIVEAGVGRVVIGTLDPHPKVSGRGARILRKAGLEVEVGVKQAECRHLVEDFAKAVVRGRPWVTAKFATSLDGKIATREGDATWITGPAARRRAHALRREHAAVAVGAGTARADDPRLTVRLGRRELTEGPVRIVISSRAAVPPGARILETAPHPPIWVACTRRASERNIGRLTARGAEIIICREAGGRVSLPDLLRRLAGRGITSLLVEGGEELLGAFFDARLVDRVEAFVAPKVIGGARAKGPVGGRGIGRLRDAPELREVKTRRAGEDVWISGYVTDVDELFARVPVRI